MSTPAVHANPYVGPQSFQPGQGDLFFGRDREAGELLALIIANRVVLFFAQSGAGKTSLLNARLFPELARKRFEVLPIGRVSGERPDHVAVDNIFVFNLISYLNIPKFQNSAMAHTSLPDFLGRLARVGGKWVYQPPAAVDAGAAASAGSSAAAVAVPAAVGATVEAPPLGVKPAAPAPELQIPPRILIIDQFEEIFTSHPEAWEQRADFFIQVRQALDDDPYLWVLFAMREDSVGALSPYAHLLPDGLRTRYYMQLMDEEAALAAVKQPAALYGHEFAPGVAELLTRNLRQIEGRQPTNGSAAAAAVGAQAAGGPDAMAAKVGQFVEPVQLQVVCWQLWESLQTPPGTPITMSDLEKLAGGAGPEEFVNDALRVYYDQSLAVALRRAPAGVSERTLRNWFDQAVITKDGKRNLMQETEDEAEGMPNDVVNALVDRVILRRDTRSERHWIELAHDRFVEPIRRSNRQWFAREPSSILARAELWQTGRRDPNLLLTGPDLEDAVKRVKAHPHDFLPLEQEFTAASQEAALEAADKRRKTLLAASTVALVAVVAVAAVIFGMWYLERTARREADVAKVVAQAAQATAESAQATAVSAQATTAASLAASQKSELAAEAAGLALRSESLLDYPQLALLLAAQSSAIQDAGEQVAPAVERALHHVLGTTGGTAVSLENAEPQALALAENGRLAVGDAAGAVWVWDDPADRTQAPRQLPALGSAVQALAFGPDGSTLVSMDGDKILVWDLAASPATTTTVEQGGEQAWAVALLTDTLAAVGPAEGDADALAGRVRLWNIREPAKPLREWIDPSGPSSFVVFSRDGKYLLTGANEGSKGTVRVWDMTTTQPLSVTLTADSTRGWNLARNDTAPDTPPVARSQVRALAASSSADQFAVSWEDGTIVLYDLPGLHAVELRGPQAEPTALAFLHGGRQLAGAYAGDNRVWVWDLGNPAGAPAFLRGQEGEIRQLAANPQDTLATVGAGGEARVWAQSNLVYEPQTLLAGPNPLVHIALAPGGGSLAAVYAGDARVHLTDLGAGGPARALGSGGEDEVTTAIFADGEGTLLAGTRGGVLTSWDLRTGELGWTGAGHTQRINDIAVAPGGGLAATASDDGSVRLWDLRSGAVVAVLAPSTTPLLLDVAFSPDGATLAAAGADGFVHLWDVAGKKELESLGADTGQSSFTSLAFQAAAGGAELAAAKEDGSIWRWDLASRKLLPAPVPGAQVSALAYDSRHLLAAYENGDIKLWYLDAMDALPAVLQAHSAGVRDLIVDPERGAYLLSAGDDGTVRRWDLDIGSLAAKACRGAGRVLRPEEWTLLRELVAGHETRDICAEDGAPQ